MADPIPSPEDFINQIRSMGENLRGYVQSTTEQEQGIRYITDPVTGRRYAQEYIAPTTDIWGNVTPGGWQIVDKYFPQEAGGGGGGIDPAIHWAQIELDKQRLQLEREGLSESIRSNQATEAENRRQRALNAASDAVSAYLTGTQLADARRLSAFQESRALLPSLVSPDQKYFAGQEPGGALDVASQRFGLPFKGSEIQHKQLTPAALAIAPTQQNVGSDILNYLNQVTQAGQAQ